MAASGFTPISLYSSTTASAVPLSANLTDGELAINITDGKLYYKDNLGVVTLLADKGTTTGNFTNLTVSGTFAANGGATLGNAIGDALTINSGAVSVPNGLNFDSNTLVIDAANNRIGVNMASPTVALDVSGAVRGSSDASFNGVLVGRGSGNASSNTVIGSGALASNTFGGQNTALGYQTLSANTTGGDNVAIGYQALAANTFGTQSVAIGYQALLNSTGFGNLNTAVGWRALGSNTSGQNNVGIGPNALGSNTTGGNNVGIGNAALSSVTTGMGNTAINVIDSSFSYAPVFDPTTQNNRFCMGSTSVTNAYIQVAWTVVSDARDKTDFAPVPHGLNFVNKLKPTAYRYKENRKATEGHGPVRYGFKAQEVLALEGDNPVIVDAEDSEKLRFNDQALLAVLVNAINDLTAEVNRLKAKLPK